jgi:hypothetical protein
LLLLLALPKQVEIYPRDPKWQARTHERRELLVLVTVLPRKTFEIMDDATVTSKHHGDITPTPTPDPIQLSLDAVTRRLVRPGFLHNLTPSRLPSQAASDSSLSPGEPPHSGRSARASFGQHAAHLPHSNLNLIVSSQDVIDEIDLVAPLIQDPPAELEHDHEHASAGLNHRVRTRLESAFVGARRAYANMAAERGFQSFSHRHQDLVLAVDFNYFGTRMVTAGSDHRLKVWDKKDDSWNLVESWKAHDAEIVDVSALLLCATSSSHLVCLFKLLAVASSWHVHSRFATLAPRDRHR